MIKTNGQELDIDIGHRHLVIQRRYEALGALNDLLIAVWFLIGSFFFLNAQLVESGTLERGSLLNLVLERPVTDQVAFTSPG